MAQLRILLLNPNSTTQMTDSMKKAAEKACEHIDIEIWPYTTPSAPKSINNAADIQASVEAVLRDTELDAALAAPPSGGSSSASHSSCAFEGILVACFSVHPLVAHFAKKYPETAVTGIFEASVITALPLLQPPPAMYGEQAAKIQQWGIVTTGEFWEDHLAHGVASFLGHSPEKADDGNSRFAGVFSTGLDAGDLHTASKEEVEQKMSEATRKLLEGRNVGCVVMGCGAMTGLAGIIRRTAGEVYGETAAKSMYMFDGVKAGVMVLESMIESRKLFQ